MAGAGVTARCDPDVAAPAARASRRAASVQARAVLAASALGAAGGWNITNVGAIASEVAHAYRVDLVTVGLFTTALFATHLLAQVPGGRASDALGAWRVGMGALALMVAGNALALVAPDPALGIGARTFTGVGTGLGFIAGVGYLRDTGASAFAQGIFGGVGVATSALALAVVPLLEPAFAWRAAFWAPLAFALGAAMLLATAPRVPTRAAHTAAPGRQLVRDGRLYRLAGLYSASFGLSVVLSNWVSELLERHGDLTPRAAAIVAGLTLAPAAISRPLGGWLVRARPRETRASLGGSLAMAAVGTVALLVAQPAWLAALGAAMLGFGSGLAFAPAMTAAARTRPDAPNAAVGYVNSAALLVILAGTPLVGLTFSLPGDGRLGFAIVAALWLVALVGMPSRRVLALTPSANVP